MKDGIEGLAVLDLVFIELLYDRENMPYLDKIIRKLNTINHSEEWYSKEKLNSKTKLLHLYQLMVYMSLQELSELKK